MASGTTDILDLAMNERAQAQNLLHLVDLLSDLDTAQLNEIGRQCRWQRYPKGVEIISESERSTDIFFIVEGSVVAKSYSEDGKEVTFTELSRGDIFGEFSAIDQKPRSAAIETLEESLVGQMTSDRFRELVMTVPGIGLRLAELLVRKNRFLTHRIFEFSTLAVRQRVCAELLRRATEAGETETPVSISPAPTHYQLATMLGTHREAVSRELSALSALGIVEVGRKKITILDIPRLRQITRVSV
jgi:CRP-like cAMP-binding protein